MAKATLSVFQRVDDTLTADVVYTAVPAGVAYASVRIWNKSDTDTIYWTDDNTEPSATVGDPLPPGTGYEYPAGVTPRGPIKLFSTGAAPFSVAYA